MSAKHKLTRILSTVSDLKGAAAVLEWDQETYMPAGAAEARAKQVGTLRRLAHEAFTRDETGSLITGMLAEAGNEQERRFAHVLERDFHKAQRIPAALVAEKAEASGDAKEAWKQARETDAFEGFSPHLKRITDINIRWADALGYDENRYDALLDEFEPDAKSREISTVFEALRRELVPIVKTIAKARQVEADFLYTTFPKEKQWDFGMRVLRDFGYDFNHGRQDYSAHPFTTTFDISDVRITTRVLENYLPAGLFGTLHECGHALYEQGIDPTLARTPLAEGTSLGLHESQSRLWENQVGRSRAFWEYYYPTLQSVFPDQLGSVSLDSFYRAINKSEPSLIRVEADEVTYNLHIMLRFEIELGLINETLDVEHLPEIWNESMRDYLGIVPKNNTEGVLQDIHWSLGAMGYFPTYALGTLMSAQIFDAATETLGDLNAQFAKGMFNPLRDWLGSTIHQHGRLYSADEILKNVTGSDLSPEPWLAYIRSKYGQIYGF